MTMGALNGAVLVSNALVVPCGRHAVMRTKRLVACCQVCACLGVEITGRSREAVSRVRGRGATCRPKGILQAFGQGDEALATQDNVSMLKPRPRQSEVIKEVVKWLPGDRYIEGAHIGEIR